MARQNFFENPDGYSTQIMCGSKNSSKSLYLARFSRYKHFCVLQFLARQKLFEIWDGYSTEIPCGSKISSKWLYLAQFSRYKHFCVLHFLGKIRKFKMVAIFWRDKIFLKIEMATLQRYPVGQNFVKIAHLARFLRYKHFVFCNFSEKFKKSK